MDSTKATSLHIGAVISIAVSQKADGFGPGKMDLPIKMFVLLVIIQMIVVRLNYYRGDPKTLSARFISLCLRAFVV